MARSDDFTQPNEPKLDDEGRNIVMPFMVCESKGGPYDDAAFVAGFRAGIIDAYLATDPNNPVPETFFTEPELIPQLDLIAMRHGYTCLLYTSPSPRDS